MPRRRFESPTNNNKNKSRPHMNRYLVLVSALLIGVLPTHTTLAANVTTYGAGLSSCQAYLAARDASVVEEVSFVDWLGGYFSAVNRVSRHRNNLLGLEDLKVMLQHLDTTCRARPDLRFAAAAGLLVLGAKPGPATHAGEVATYGSADKACHLFVEARGQQQAEYWGEFLHWLGGYLSGVNAMSLSTSNVLGETELGDALHWLDNFCTAHPATSFRAAVDELVASTGSGQSNGSAL